MAAFKATFSDGYIRTIAHPNIRNLKSAVVYAQNLERWFKDGNKQDRNLVSVVAK